MKKMLISFCMIFSVLTIGAQSNKTTKQPTQQDLDKALKDAQDLINKQDLPPEVKEYLKNSNVNPADITKSIQIDKATMDAYKNQPKGIINTDTIIDEEEEAKMRLASIGTSSTQKIGPEGGVVTSKNGKVKLTIPKGALTKLTEIRIVETKNESPNGCGNSFDLLPDGLVFNKPAKLTLKYTSNETNGTHPKALRILTKTADGDYEVDMNTTVDIYNKTVSSEINHFSNWGFASVLSLNIYPKYFVNEIIKGKTIKLHVIGWNVKPNQKETKNGKLTISKETKEMLDFVDKEGWIDKRDIVGFYKVKNWELKGDNPNVNNIGVLTPVSKDLIQATYTAPKIISNAWLTRIVNIFVNLDINEMYPYAKFIKDKDLQLMFRLKIVEDGELTFSVNGTNVTALELSSTKYAKLMKKQANDNSRISDQTTENGNTEGVPIVQPGLLGTVICYMKNGKLYIKSNGTQDFFGVKPYIGLTLCIPNPKIGGNTLSAHTGTDDDDAMLNGFFEGDKNFTADLTQVKRNRNAKGECDYSKIYNTREIIISEFDKKIGGMVSGQFDIALFQDNEKLEDACLSSKEVSIMNGRFTLTISNIEK